MIRPWRRREREPDTDGREVAKTVAFCLTTLGMAAYSIREGEQGAFVCELLGPVGWGG